MALTDDIVGYWKLENTDDSANSNDLTNNGATTGATGQINDCFDFERGDSDYANVTLSSPAFPTGDFSFSAWVKAESQNNYQKVCGIDKSESGNHGVMGIENSSGNKWKFFVVNTADGFTDADANSTFSTGTWYFIVGTYNDSTNELKLFIDGTEQTDSPNLSGTRATATGDFNLGAGFYGGSRGNYFDGLIDEVGLWDRVLSPSEVTQLWNSGSGLTYPFTSAGWTGTINGVTNPTSVCGIAVANIQSINGVT